LGWQDDFDLEEVAKSKNAALESIKKFENDTA